MIVLISPKQKFCPSSQTVIAGKLKRRASSLSCVSKGSVIDLLVCHLSLEIWTYFSSFNYNYNYEM